MVARDMSDNDTDSDTPMLSTKGRPHAITCVHLGIIGLTLGATALLCCGLTLARNQARRGAFRSSELEGRHVGGVGTFSDNMPKGGLHQTGDITELSLEDASNIIDVNDLESGFHNFLDEDSSQGHTGTDDNVDYLKDFTDSDLDELLGNDHEHNFDDTLHDIVVGDGIGHGTRSSEGELPLMQFWHKGDITAPLHQAANGHASHHLMRQFRILYLFKVADKNKDGYVAGPELVFVADRLTAKFRLDSKRYDTLFAKADSNSDGKLRMPELWRLISECIESAVLEPTAEKVKKKFHISDKKFQELLKNADTNADGKLSLKEAEHLIFTIQENVPFIRMKLHFMMHVLFKKADWNKNGFIDGRELRFIAHQAAMRFGVDMKEYEESFAKADSNKDGQLDKKEFKQLLVTLQAKSPFWWMHRWVVHIFKKFDWDDDGVIEGPELRPLAHRFVQHDGIPRETYNNMFKKADKNADNKLDLKEFRELMILHKSWKKHMQKQSLAEKF